MKIIGLTGSIATGKSTVSQYLQQKGYSVIDCDVIARQVVEPHHQGLQQLVEKFGVNILQADGTLNRERFGQLLFAQPSVRQEVNALLHPLIFEEVARQIEHYRQQGKKICFVDMPLLFEVHYEKNVDEVWLVYTSSDIQLQRLMVRNQLSEFEARQKIQSQIPIEEKIAKSDIVIDNSYTIFDTYKQIDVVLQKMKGEY